MSTNKNITHKCYYDNFDGEHKMVFKKNCPHCNTYLLRTVSESNIKDLIKWNSGYFSGKVCEHCLNDITFYVPFEILKKAHNLILN